MATSSQPATRRLRERLLREDLVECVISLPPRIFGHTDTTACLWVLNKDKSPRPDWNVVDRRGHVLFINARRAFEAVPRSRARRLGEKHCKHILATLAIWRGSTDNGDAPTDYRDEPGWSRSCSTKEVAGDDYKVLPTRWATEPLDPECDTRRRIDQLKQELIDDLTQVHTLETQLLDALEEI